MANGLGIPGIGGGTAQLLAALGLGAAVLGGMGLFLTPETGALVAVTLGFVLGFTSISKAERTHYIIAVLGLAAVAGLASALPFVGGALAAVLQGSALFFAAAVIVPAFMQAWEKIRR